MKLKKIAIATMMALSASSAYSGSFVQLTNGNGTTLTSGNGGLKNGAQNVNSDIFNLFVSSATYVSGYADTNANGEVVANSINYNTYTSNPSNITGSGTLTLLNWRVTRGVDLSAGSKQADIFDFVYRDSVDGKLVFATRYLNRVANNEEANYLYRYNFSTNVNYAPQVAWLFSTDNDLRMYQAGLTTGTSLGLSASYTPGVVRQKGDFSLSEGNPWSGLFLVKSDATTAYTIKSNTIGYFQAGEEGQPKVGGSIAGFAATNLSTGVAANETSFANGGTYGSAGTSSSVQGTLNIQSGTATFNSNVAVTNGAVINTASGARSTFNGLFNQQVGAQLNGGGTFAFNGGYAAGNSPGAATINGNVIFGTSNEAIFEIGGLTLGSQYDHLTVNGNLTYGGVLKLSFINGYTGNAGDTFNLFDFTSSSGAFSLITFLNVNTLSTGLGWSFNQSNGVLTIIPVPEPDSYALLMFGIGIASLARRQKK